MTDHPKIPADRLREIIADDRETPLHAMTWVERLSACTELLALRAERDAANQRTANMMAKLREDLGADIGPGGGFVEILTGIDGLREQRDAARAELAAVMQLAVDKWLDDDEGNPATRAARAREVALKAIESAERERDAARAEAEKLNGEWADQIAAALCSTAESCGRTPSMLAGHVRREHEAHTACFDRLVKAREELAAEKRKRDELVAIARHVVFEGLTANHEPPLLIPSEKLRERLAELRRALAAEQPKLQGGA